MLEDTGLTGVLKDGEEAVYAVGEHFLSLVTFLGCAPQISLTDEAAVQGQPVCRICLHDFDAVQLLESQPASTLRCAACRTPQRRPSEPEHNQQLTCPECGESSPLFRFDWRRSAAFGCFFVEIENVFPHEAVPADRLMEALEALSGHGWDYFYLSR